MDTEHERDDDITELWVYVRRRRCGVTSQGDGRVRLAGTVNRRPSVYLQRSDDDVGLILGGPAALPTHRVLDELIEWFLRRVA